MPGLRMRVTVAQRSPYMPSSPAKATFTFTCLYTDTEHQLSPSPRVFMAWCFVKYTDNLMVLLEAGGSKR